MKYIAPLSIIALLFLSGCNSPATQPSSPISAAEQTSESQMPGQFGGFSFGDDASWPDYLPEDIPPIPASITMVMEDANQIRIFFSDLPEDEFKSYLLSLQQQGFSLEYIVYEQAGMPEGKADEMIDQGKFDAVRITKGTYSMNIEYGDGQGTLDIDPSGLPEGTVIGSGPKWPEELAGIIDQPEGCSIQSVASGNNGETIITCESENTSMLRNYMAEISAQGFAEYDRSEDQNGELIKVSYIRGSVKIDLKNYQPGLMGITVYTNAEAEEVFGKSVDGGWPQGLPSSLPVFPGGQVISSLKTSDATVKIIISLEDTTDIQAYRDTLIENGFTVQGSDNSVFVNADCMVTIEEYINSDFFSITVEII